MSLFEVAVKHGSSVPDDYWLLETKSLDMAE